jgi:hypothetical protein
MIVSQFCEMFNQISCSLFAYVNNATRQRLGLAAMASPEAERKVGDTAITKHLNHLSESLESPKQRLDSSSSPHLPLEPKNADVPDIQGVPRTQLTRSNTLPRTPNHVSPRTFVNLEQAKLHRFKQWMVCIAIGERCNLISH